MKFLNSGKVKDVYDMGDDTLMFNFSNRVSAYDVKFQDEIPKKVKFYVNLQNSGLNNLMLKIILLNYILILKLL